jgi:hypothetical protein
MTDQPNRCPRCWCDDCGGTLAEHAGPLCSCPDCHAIPRFACTQFIPDRRIAYIAEQLGPLFSTHLGPRQQQRCLAVAHAAHHALIDYDTPKEQP